MRAHNFTPGPWRIAIDFYGAPYQIIAGEVGRPIRIVDLPAVTLNVANARLIAAAPDLLTACEALCGVFEGSDDAPSYVIKARAAIAKATQ